MKLENIKVNFLGDSITEGTGTSGADKIFHALLAKKYCLTARNYGIGGTRIAYQTTPSANERWDRSFSDRFSQMDDDADLVVVFGGTNDYGHGDAPIGAFEDRDPSTFYGGCHFLMKGLIEKYPEATIVIMTPLHRAVEERVRNGETLYLKKYVEIIKEVAEYYSLPVIDLWAISGIQPKVDVIKAKYCPDGLHPNDAGHVLMAERIGNFLERL